MPVEAVLARAALHPWEEPPLSGIQGAGTVFFSGCALGCVFCQNQAISQEDFGKEVTVPRLREIFWELIQAGAHNIDLVRRWKRPCPSRWCGTAGAMTGWRPCRL